MSADPARGPLALRIDVDFPVGLRRAVPRFLERLGEAGMKATFFVVAGRNQASSSWRRIFRPGYARRLGRLGPLRIVRQLGLRALTVDAGFADSQEARRILQRVLAEGHELAVHGYDHTWWADHVWNADAPSIEAQIDRAYDAFAPIAGRRDLAWGSPSWRTCPIALRHLQRVGVPYLSECWGRSPFLTVLDDGETLPIPHLPISLPSFESLVTVDGASPEQAVRRVLAARSRGGADVLCFHDYFEGLMMPELLDAFLEQTRRAGIKTTTLEEAAAATARSGRDLDACRLRRGPVPGFEGDVSWQGEAA